MTAQDPDDDVVLRPSDERGTSQRDWLESYHSFAFGGYRDMEWTRWGPLRVLNEDYVAPGAGFPPHDHENMEIVTYPVEGAVAHEDNSGGDGVIRSGQVQRMTAGTGITHSEANASDTDELHLLQIWFLPERDGLAPSYETVTIEDEPDGGDGLYRFGAPDPAEDEVKIHQDVELYTVRLDAGNEAELDTDPDRVSWIQLIDGTLEIEGHRLEDGDGAGLRNQTRITLNAHNPSHALLFDMGTN